MLYGVARDGNAPVLQPLAYVNSCSKAPCASGEMFTWMVMMLGDPAPLVAKVVTSGPEGTGWPQ